MKAFIVKSDTVSSLSHILQPRDYCHQEWFFYFDDFIHWKDWCWSSDTLATGCEEPTHWKRPWCWERLRAGEKGDNRGWDGWMASSTQWTWVWANSGRCWKTGKTGVLQSMGLQSWTQLSNWTTYVNQYLRRHKEGRRNYCWVPSLQMVHLGGERL